MAKDNGSATGATMEPATGTASKPGRKPTVYRLEREDAEGKWEDLPAADTGLDFASLDEAMACVVSNQLVGSYRIVAIKRQFVAEKNTVTTTAIQDV